MTEQQVARILGLLDDGRWRSPGRVKWLTRLSGIYEGEGVLTSRRAPALYRACPSAAECWDGAEERASDSAETPWSGDNDGSIFWPWVGESYRAGGVCLVGMNIHHAGDWWSINVEYAIVAEQTPHLEQGRRRMPKGSMFAYRGGASAMAALASLDGRDPAESPDPREVTPALERIARLQAVKCSPLRNKSNPTRAMCACCPPRFLQRELAILRPRVIVGLGVDARRGVESAGVVTWEREDHGYRRGALAIGTRRPIDVLLVPHPSVRGRAWPDAQAALVHDLRRNPVG